MINVSIIGFGNVGSTLSLLLLRNSSNIRLNIMEPDSQSEGAILDLSHGLPLLENKELYVNDVELLCQANFIFYAAGIPNDHGKSRFSKAKDNILLAEQIFKDIKFEHSPYVIVITNPVDLITNAIQQFSGLPSQKVIGTGTFLDSNRMSFYLSNSSKFKASEFDSMVCGEHGDSQVAIFSNTYLNGQSILNFPEFDRPTLNHISNQTKKAAFKIRETQEGTTYGVSICAEALFNFLINRQQKHLCLSVKTNTHYRQLLQLSRDIYIGLPVLINDGKIELNNGIQFADQELSMLVKSAQLIEHMHNLHLPI